MLVNLFANLVFAFLLFFGAGVSPAVSDSSPLVVGLSADYPPMEFREGDVFRGFDVDLARLVGKELGREVVLRDMPFSGLLPALNSGEIHIVISSVTITPERQNHFDFSETYHAAELALLFPRRKEPPASLKGVRTGCQSGSTMALWVQNHAPEAVITLMDLNPPLVEALKAGHLDGVVLEAEQAREFCNRSPDLGWRSLGVADQGYGMVFAKGSPLVGPVNAVLARKKEDIAALRAVWKI